ncbi:MAG: hypothetical protein LBJ01_03285 [Tannerella sp.]|jgi:hypothetical protein|nr:hypothetical protein [Tannerella sp.]
MKSRIQYFSLAARSTHSAPAAICQRTNLSGTPAGRLRKRLRHIAGLLAIFAALCLGNQKAEAQGTYDTPINVSGMGEYVIPATPQNVTYYFSGTSAATNRINVTQGFRGSIYLKGCNITTTGTNQPPIRIQGVNGNTWADYTSAVINDAVVANPVTIVDIILEGNNFLQNTATVCAVLQVDLGAQINIKSHLEQPLVRPTDEVNDAGTLEVRKTASPTVTYNSTTRTFTGNPAGSSTGAAIGGPTTYQGRTNVYHKGSPEVIVMPPGPIPTYGGQNYSSGGNVTITSGTIIAIGGDHAAGIGGPHRNTGCYYNGIIMIYGGIVSAISGSHGAGIGSGCPTGHGVIPYVGGASMIIAIPPASVRAVTRQTTPTPPYVGLAGARDIAYIGDPEAGSHFTVYTEDFAATTMYLDLSQNPRIKRTIDSLAPQFNPARLYLGETNVYQGGSRLIGGNIGTFFGGRDRLDGDLLWTYPAPNDSYDFSNKYILQNAAVFNTKVTFFTDQTNDKGYQYAPVRDVTFPSGSTFSQNMVELLAPRFKPTLECIPAVVVAPDTSALVYGYDDTEALNKASTLVIRNDGNQDLLDLTFQLKADAFTDVSGNSLSLAITAALAPALKDTTIDGVARKYFPKGASVTVQTLLKPNLEPGDYEGQVMFDASDIPAGSLSPIPFFASVVRYYLEKPVLTTVPPGMNVTNGTPFRVMVTFDEPVRGVQESDFVITNGRLVSGSLDSISYGSIVNYMGTDYNTQWSFMVDTVGYGALLESGSVIQITAWDSCGYERHDATTTELSNTLTLTLNTETPFATFHFDYDLPLDSVFLKPLEAFTFSITANGSGAAFDSVRYNNASADYGTGLDVQDPLNISSIQDFINIYKNGIPIPADWVLEDVGVDGNNTFLINSAGSMPDGFEEGDYEVVLNGDTIVNNADLQMLRTIGKFSVRIAELDCDASAVEDNAGLGIRPMPDSLGFLGGDAELVLLGKNLQYAADAHALRVKLPVALGDVTVEPTTVSAAGDSAVFRIHIPNNNTEVNVNYDFLALMFGDTAKVTTSYCPQTKPVARITVKPAPAVEIENPDLCPQCGPEVTVWDPWTQGCENRYAAYVPKTGFDRVVTVSYLGLADKYLYSWGGGRTTTVVLPADEDQFELFFMTARVPDELEGQKGAIVISTPSLPSDTSEWFSFWNAPDLSRMVYYPRTTMYAGLLDFNNQSGSPDMLRSFNGGVTWESAWAPISGIDLERFDHEILFREPGSCCTV